MNCKNCGASLKLKNGEILVCEYCGSEFIKEEYGISNIPKKYDKKYLRVAKIEKTIFSFSNYKALIQYMPPIIISKNIVIDKDEFVVDFDVYEENIDIISDIPERFKKEDIKDVIVKALLEFSHPFKKGSC